MKLIEDAIDLLIKFKTRHLKAGKDPLLRKLLNATWECGKAQKKSNASFLPLKKGLDKKK